MDPEDRSVRDQAKESMRCSVERAVDEAYNELAGRGTALTRRQVVRRMLGNVPLALHYYERINAIDDATEHAELHASAELLVELLREMEQRLRN